MIFRLWHEVETFSLVTYAGVPPAWKVLSRDQVIESLTDMMRDGDHLDASTLRQRPFLVAAGVLIPGEREHRHLVQRKTATGARNIRMKVRPAAEYAEETFFPQVTTKLRKGLKRTKKEAMNFETLTRLIKDSLAPVKEMLGLPAVDPVINSYTIPEEVILAASKECRDYLRLLKKKGVLTSHALQRLREKLTADFPGDAVAVIEAAVKSREHLAAISLNTRDGHLVVMIVNQRGDMVTMEGWKLLRLIDEHDTPLILGSLERRGEWQSKPLLEINNNKTGELIGVYTASDSTLQVALRQEVTGNKGKEPKGSEDRAAFILDQDYLVSLYVAIAQLKEDREKFERLREEAEARRAINVDDLFDPGLFQLITKRG